MLLPSIKTHSFLLLASLTLLTTGCSSLAHFSDPSTATSPLPAISGTIHGGQQPVSGAIIQLYAANTTTNKGLSTPLLTHPPTSGSNGTFTITDTNYCPAPGSMVYLVATGGNPGLTPPVGGTINNTALALMALLGTCSTLSSATVINVNELTTVAAVEALAPFMADSTHVGADASNPNGLAGAFAGAAAIVNFTTGAFVTPPTGVTLPTALYNTLANILAACVNTNGSTANGTACGTLFINAVNGTTTDTILAMLHIAQLPAQNVPNLYGIVNTTGPFQTALLGAPTSFIAATSTSLPALAVGSTGYKVAIDTFQHIWVYDSAAAYAQPVMPGPIRIYDNSGNLIFALPSGSGGIFNPLQLVPDPFGNMWVLNLVNPSLTTLVKFDPTGAPLSPNNGYPLAAAFASQYGSVSIDPSGNVWIAGTSSQSTTTCYAELNNSGVDITPANHFCPSNVTFHGTIMTTDQNGNAYLNGFYKISPTGVLLPYTNSGLTGFTNRIFYDRANNQLWGVAETLDSAAGLVAYRADGSTLISDLRDASLTYMYGEAMDGAGNLWYGYFGTSLLGEVTSSGSFIAKSTGIPVPEMSGETGMAIDAYGNLWVTDRTPNLTKIIGLVTPKSYQ